MSSIHVLDFFWISTHEHKAKVVLVIRKYSLRTIAKQAGTTLVIANNHFEGKAMKLALELVARTTGTLVEVPELLVSTYPDLATVARRTGQGRLFD